MSSWNNHFHFLVLQNDHSLHDDVSVRRSSLIASNEPNVANNVEAPTGVDLGSTPVARRTRAQSKVQHLEPRERSKSKQKKKIRW